MALSIQLGALTPFLTLVTEEHGFGRPESGTVFIWNSYVAPEDSRATAILSGAANAVAGRLDHLDPSSPAAKPTLKAIVGLPREIRAEAARGLGHRRPLPQYAAAAMNQVASQIGDAVASHWRLLPLAIRYAAAEATARHGGLPGAPP